MDLAEFLQARLDEDEREARQPVPGPWEIQGEPRETLVYSRPFGTRVAVGWLRDLRHIARHDPARVLAEVATKRRMVERHRVCDDVWFGDVSTCPDMRDLAAPYADHPDYREEWRP